MPSESIAQRTLFAGALLEEFTLSDNALIRELTSARATGKSTVSLDSQGVRNSVLPHLQSLWDKQFLTGDIDHELRTDRTIGIADVFCGAGGLSYGVSEAVRALGMEPRHIFAADADHTALEVYRRNFDPLHCSSHNVWTSVTKSYSTRNSSFRFVSDPRVLTEELQSCVGKVDILLGGPPCQGHSPSNNRTLRMDPRNMLYIAMPALAVALDASCVIVENVPGVRHDSKGILDHAMSLFRSAGYHLDQEIVSATVLGLPQTRKRHILIASKGADPDLAAAVNALARQPRDLRWAIGDLNGIDSESLLDMPADLTPINRQRIDYLFDNGEYNLPNNWRPEGHRNGHTYPSIYGRLRWDRPSGTITTGFSTPGRGRYIHPEQRRTLTPHEAARIQGFPDRFEFRFPNGELPTRNKLAEMIGNAVPPQIGFAAALAALATLPLGTGRR